MNKFEELANQTYAHYSDLDPLPDYTDFGAICMNMLYDMVMEIVSAEEDALNENAVMLPAQARVMAQGELWALSKLKAKLEALKNDVGVEKREK